MKTRKKWLRKTTAICTAALLGTAVIPSTAFAADDYASIEKNAWAAAVKNMEIYCRYYFYNMLKRNS